jgi:hypothetical protein
MYFYAPVIADRGWVSGLFHFEILSFILSKTLTLAITLIRIVSIRFLIFHNLEHFLCQDSAHFMATLSTHSDPDLAVKTFMFVPKSLTL